MKWTYEDNCTWDNVFDRIITTYEAETELDPLYITVMGHYRHHHNDNIEWVEIDKYCIYKGYKIRYEYIKYADGTFKDDWIAILLPKPNTPGTRQDRHFKSLQSAMKTIDNLP